MSKSIKKGDLHTKYPLPSGSSFVLVLPVRLLEAVESFGLSLDFRNRLLRLISSYFTKCRENGCGIGELWEPMPQQYLDTVLGEYFRRNQWRVIHHNPKQKNSAQFEEAIFFTDGFYKKNETPLHFKLNPDLLTGEKTKIEVPFDSNYFEINSLFQEIINYQQESILKLELNSEELISKLQHENEFYDLEIKENYCLIFRGVVNYMNNYNLDGLPHIFVDTFQMNEKTWVLRMNISVLKKYLDQYRAKLPSQMKSDARIIIDGQKITVETVSYYVQKRSERAIKYAQNLIDTKSYHNSSINVAKVNGRLTSGMTNIPNYFLRHFKLNGEPLCSLDLKTSQITILANLIAGRSELKKSLNTTKYENLKIYLKEFYKIELNSKKIPPFLYYLNHSDIYEGIADDLKVTRDIAKREMFRILFTSPNAALPKYTIRSYFPDFFKDLKKIKECFEHNFGESKTELAYFLQLVEAHIFLERIFPQLMQAGIPAFTKHDSILCPLSSKEKVLAIINSSFNEIGFKGKIKVTEHLPPATMYL